MAKGLPYFKFTPSEWLTGDICFEDLEAQGLFINICAWYWQRDGVLSIDDINKRYNKPTALISLSNRFFNVQNNLISIEFLDEQLEERKHISKTNSKNGSLGGRPKALKTLEEKPNALISLSETKANENPIRIRKEKEEKKEKNTIPSFFDFLAYAKTLDGFHEKLEKPIKTKYDSWVANNWKDGHDKKITNWKSKLINTMPYIVKDNPVSTFKINFPR